jgi:hypothetical protein
VISSKGIAKVSTPRWRASAMRPGGAARQAAGFQVRAQIFLDSLIQKGNTLQGEIGVIGVIDNASPFSDSEDMTGQTFWLKGGEEIHRVPMAGQRMAGDAYIVVAVPAHDVGIVLPPAEQVQPSDGAGTCEHPCRGIDAAALRAADAPGEVSFAPGHAHLLVSCRRLSNGFQVTTTSACQPSWMMPMGAGRWSSRQP